LSEPTGLAFGSSGNLYATFFGSRTIEEFDTNGVGTVFANTGLDNPMGIAVQQFDEAHELGQCCWAIGDQQYWGSVDADQLRWSVAAARVLSV
jgi:hypothetical protein